jgi:hypothetical protein
MIWGKLNAGGRRTNGLTARKQSKIKMKIKIRKKIKSKSKRRIRIGPVEAMPAISFS